METHIFQLADGGRIEYRGRIIPVGDRGGLPQYIRYEHPGAPAQPAVELGLEVVDGVPWCVYSALSGQPGGSRVKATDLRGAADTLEDLIEKVLAAIAFEKNKGGWKREMSTARAGTSKLVMPEIRRARRRTNHTVTRDLLTRVADVYRATDSAPTDAVAKAFGVSRRTAGRYVQLARDAELLPITTQGKVTR